MFSMHPTPINDLVVKIIGMWKKVTLTKESAARLGLF